MAGELDAAFDALPEPSSGLDAAFDALPEAPAPAETGASPAARAPEAPLEDFPGLPETPPLGPIAPSDEAPAFTLRLPGLGAQRDFVAPSDVTRYTEELTAAEAEKDRRHARLRAAFQELITPRGNDGETALAVAQHLEVPVENARTHLQELRDTGALASFDVSRWERDNPVLARAVLTHPDMGRELLVAKEPGPILRHLSRVWAGLKAEVVGAQDKAAVAAFGGVKTPAAQKRVEGAKERLAADEAEREAALAAADAPQMVLEQEDAKARVLREDPSLAARAVTVLVRGKEAAANLELSRKQWALMLAEVQQEQRGGNEADVLRLKAEIHDARLATKPRAYGDDTGLMRDLAIATEGTVSTVQVGQAALKGAGAAGAVGAVAGGAVGAVATKTPAGAARGAAMGLRLLAPEGAQWNSAYETMQLEGGEAYQELRSLTTDEGKKLTATEAAGGAVVKGAVNTALELVGFHGQTKAATGALSGQVLRLLEKDRTFRRLVAKVGKEAAAGVLTEGTTEALQEAVAMVTAYAAATAKDKKLQAGDVIDGRRALQAFQAGVMGAGPITLSSTVVGTAVEAATRNQQEMGANSVEVLGELALSPEAQKHAAVLAQAISEETAQSGQPVQSLFVDAQAVVRFFQDKNPDEAGKQLDALLGPDGAQKVAEAAVSGHRVEVPLATFLERWGASDVGQALLQDSATTPDGMTLRERTPERLKAIKEAAEKLVEETAQASEEAEGVEAAVAGVEGELRAAGYTAKEASSASALWQHFWKAVGQRVGMGAEEVAARMRATFNLVPEGPMVSDASVALAQRFFGQDVETPLGKAARETDFFIDSVTGLLNARAWKRMEDAKGLAAAISIEGIKYANDKLGGHQAGDDVYRAAATALVEAGMPLDKVAKVGGDFRAVGLTQEQLDAILAEANRNPALAGFELRGLVSEAMPKEATKKKRKDLPPGGAANEKLGDIIDKLRAEMKMAERGDEPRGRVPGQRPRAAKLEGTPVPEALQAALAALPEAEAFTEAFTEAATGLLNKDGRDALLEARPRKFYVSLDLNLLKPFNDKLGDEGGDAMLRAFGQLVTALGGERYLATHISGDEFSIHGDDEVALKSFVTRLTAAWEGATLVGVRHTDGRTGSISRLSFAWGLGENVDAAEAQLSTLKEQQALAGKRSSDKARALELVEERFRPDDGRGDGGARGDVRLLAGGAYDPATGRAGLPQRALSREALAAALGGESGAGSARRLTPALLDRTKAQIDAQRESIARRRNPTLKAQAAAWLDYTLGGPRPKPDMMPPALYIKGLADDGFPDPEGHAFDESGRSLERAIGGRKKARAVGAYAQETARAQRLAFEKNVLGRTTLFQEGDEKDARGFVIPPDEGAMERVFRVFLNPTADISTVAHESAHAFFGILQHLAGQASTPQSVKDDYAAALKWMGAEEGQPLTTAQQEKWAKGFEAYLFEGKAPSSALEGAFTRFSLWLRTIYRSVASLGVELSPEIRGVFDRLLATDQEIERHRGARGPALPEGVALVSAEEAAQRADDDFMAEAFATRKAALHAARERLRETEGWWKEERAAHLRQAREDYEALPARQARRVLDGETDFNDGQPVVLERAAVEAAVGKTRKVRQAKEGLHPDALKDVVPGFATGADVLKAVLALPDKEAWAEAQADARMAEAHPSVLEDRTRLKKLVADGFHAYAESRILRDWRDLNARAGKEGAPIAKEVFEEAARMMVRKATARKLDAGGALRAERAAAREKAQAALRGEWDRALDAARRELLNAYLYKELLAARDERDALVERASELSKNKARARLGKASPVYRDAMDALLASVGLGMGDEGFSEGTLAGLRHQLEMDAVGVGEWADTLLDELRPDYRDMTMAGLRHLKEAIDQVEAAARARSFVLVAEKRLDKALVVKQLVTEIASYLAKKKPTATRQSETAGEWVVRKGSAFDGFLVGAPDLVRDLVNDDLSSTAWQALIEPMRAAKHREADLLRTAVKPVSDAFTTLPPEVKSRFMEAVDGDKLFPGHTDKKAPPRFRYELLLMALNAGNEGNLSRLLEGRGITEEQLKAALDTLTAGELAWVQSVWDAMEGLREPAFELEERMTGLRPKAVEAKPLVLANGTLRGGYFPAVYDRDSSVAGERQVAQQLAELVDPSYTRPGTPHSHLKGRVEGFSAVISLDPNTILGHLTQAAHDIAFREAVLSVGGLLLEPEVQGALKERLGAEKTAQLRQWVKDVGTMRGTFASTPLAEAQQWLRGNMGTGLLGFNAAVALGDFSNFAVAVTATPLKAKHLAAATAEVARAPKEAYREAFEKSGEFRAMEDTLRRDFAREVKKLTAKGVFETGPLGWFRESSFAFMQATQALVATPVWHGAYRQALAEGKTEADAVRFADDILTRVFPQHSAVEAAAILRDKGLAGLSTVFYGFASRMYAAQHSLLRPLFSMDFAEAGAGGKAKTLATVGGRLLAFYVAYNVMGELLMGRGPEAGDADDEEPDNAALKWARWFVRKLAVAPLSTLPLELGGLIEKRVLDKKTSPRAALMTDALVSIGHVWDAIFNEEKGAADKAEALFRALALTRGLPQSPFVKTGRYLLDVGTGEREVRGPLSAASGVLYGEKDKQPLTPLTALEELTQ